MGFAYAAITALETPVPFGCPPGWPGGWTCPPGPYPFPPGWPPTNAKVICGGQWPTNWPEDNMEDVTDDYSVWIIMPSENEYVSDGQDFYVGVVVLDHTGASTANYSGSETITLSQQGGDGTITFGNGTTITRSSQYGGFLDQVSYAINSGATETFGIKASVTISGTEYTDVRNFQASTSYIDISVDDASLTIAGDATTNTEDFTFTLTMKDSGGSTVTGYTGNVELKWTTDPQGSTPAGPTLYIYGVDGNSSYSAGTATAVAAAQTGPYTIPSALWASGTDGVVTVKCRFNSYFTSGSNTDTVIFRAEVTE